RATFSTSALSAPTLRDALPICGDGNFTASTGTLSQTVNQDGTSTTLTSSANPSVYGQAVTFTATVSASAPGAGTATGTVQFKDRCEELASELQSRANVVFRTLA